MKCSASWAKGVASAARTSASFRCGRAQAQGDDARGSTVSVFDVEGLGAGRLTVLIERDLLDTGFGLTQEPIAMGLQRLAPLIDEDGSLKLHIAFLKALDDGLELLQRLLEAHRLDVGMV